NVVPIFIAPYGRWSERKFEGNSTAGAGFSNCRAGDAEVLAGEVGGGLPRWPAGADDGVSIPAPQHRDRQPRRPQGGRAAGQSVRRDQCYHRQYHHSGGVLFLRSRASGYGRRSSRGRPVIPGATEYSRPPPYGASSRNRVARVMTVV